MGEAYPNPAAYLPEEILPGYCALVPAEPDLIVCESVGMYVPHNPERTVLYGVSFHLETFLARQWERDRVVPRFVEQELRAFLDCGVLARGFLRVHCDACGLDRVVPYSCKRWSFCPSCGGRRMAFGSGKRNPSHCHSKRKPRPFKPVPSLALTPDLRNHLEGRL